MRVGIKNNEIHSLAFEGQIDMTFALNALNAAIEDRRRQTVNSIPGFRELEDLTFMQRLTGHKKILRLAVANTEETEERGKELRDRLRKANGRPFVIQGPDADFSYRLIMRGLGIGKQKLGTSDEGFARLLKKHIEYVNA